jgi:hypothetical protein
MGWREQAHLGELTVDVLKMSSQALPGNENTCFNIDKDAAYGITLTGAYTTNGIKINQGSFKCHLHNQTAQTYNAEFKYDAQNVTGYAYGIDSTTEIEPGGSTPANRTSGGMRGIYAHIRVRAGFTLTGGYDAAMHATFTNLGTINAAAGNATAGHFAIAAGGVWTAVQQLTCLSLRSELASAVSAGSTWMLDITNAGTTNWDAAIHVNASNKITNLFELETASGMIGANVSGGSVNFNNYKAIKIDIDGTTHYLVAAQSLS